MRRLMDDPVLYRADLTDEQRGYLASPTGRSLLRQACDQAGFVLEERAEGYLAVDPDGIATDSKFADDGSHAKVAALLLLDVITGAGRPVPVGELATEAQQLLHRFRSWAKAYQSADGPDRLVADAIDILQAFQLIRKVDSGIEPLPAAFRYSISAPTEESA
jgi:uncharacterized protein (TIGR02678 family)